MDVDGQLLVSIICFRHKRYHHHLLIWLTRVVMNVGYEQHDLMIDVNVREYLKSVSTCFACASGG